MELATIKHKTLKEGDSNTEPPVEPGTLVSFETGHIGNAWFGLITRLSFTAAF